MQKRKKYHLYSFAIPPSPSSSYLPTFLGPFCSCLCTCISRVDNKFEALMEREREKERKIVCVRCSVCERAGDIPKWLFLRVNGCRRECKSLLWLRDQVSVCSWTVRDRKNRYLLILLMRIGVCVWERKRVIVGITYLQMTGSLSVSVCEREREREREREKRLEFSNECVWCEWLREREWLSKERKL